MGSVEPTIEFFYDPAPDDRITGQEPAESPVRKVSGLPPEAGAGYSRPFVHRQNGPPECARHLPGAGLLQGTQRRGRPQDPGLYLRRQGGPRKIYRGRSRGRSRRTHARTARPQGHPGSRQRGPERDQHRPQYPHHHNRRPPHARRPPETGGEGYPVRTGESPAPV